MPQTRSGCWLCLNERSTPHGASERKLQLRSSESSAEGTRRFSFSPSTSSFQPDVIIYHIKCGYPVMAALRAGRRVELLIPMPCLVHPVRDLPAIGMGQFNFRLWNKLSYAVTNSALISQALIGYGNKVMQEWNWAPMKKKEVKTFLLEEVPIEYPISSELFPRPDYWPDHVRITGFRERNKSKHWTPPLALTNFLAAYPKPLYIGFGSMINGQPLKVGGRSDTNSHDLKHSYDH
jgi:sterol 3beta-glucosyltransferase